jgi:hypothetical protein
MRFSRVKLGFWLSGVLLTIAVFCPTRVIAGDHFQPVSAEELAMKSEPLAPGAPAVILYRQVDRDDTSGYEFNYFRIKILTEEGRKYGDVEIPLLKDFREVNDLKARTIRPDGTIVNFQGKAFEKTIVKQKGMKVLAKTLALPDVQVGSIVEYYWNYIGTISYHPHWILSEELFTKHAKFSMKPSTRLTAYWSWHRLPPGTEPPKEGSDSIIRLEARNLPAFQAEDFMPPENELKSRVDFVYAWGTAENDDAKFWKQVGKDWNESLEHFANKSGWTQKALAEIVAPGDTPEIKLQEIYTRVREIRNTSYEEDKTAKEEKRENPKEIHTAEDVWKRGYGTAREITWLYLDLVRAAGFEAYGLALSDRENYFFNARSRDRYSLDVAAVQIKLNGKDIYCDPGAKFSPFGLLPWYETGVDGLRLDKQGGTWIKTPVPASAESREERKADLKLSDTGDLEGKVTLTYTGFTAMFERYAERNDDGAARKKYLEDQLKRTIPAHADVELTNHPEWDNPAVPLVAEFDLKIPGWASGAGRRVLLPAGLFGGAEKHLFDHTERVHPIYMPVQFQEVDDAVIELPAGWQVGSLPPAKTQDGHIITYSMKAANENGKLRLTRVLDVNFLFLQTQYYLALRNFIQQVRAGDEQQIVLQTSTATASK